MTEEKNLSVKNIEELAKEFNEQKEIFITLDSKDGSKKVGLKIDKVFNPTKILLCVKEYFAKVDHLRIYVKDYNNIEDFLQTWMMLMIVKHFSSLEIPYDFKRQLAILEKMIDTKILFQIYSHFDDSEINKVMKETGYRAKKVTEHLEDYKDEIEQLELNYQKNKEDINEIIENKSKQVK
jgi:hypothetical protein